jgi:hypothetical protein
LESNLFNTGLYALSKTSGNNIKLVYQSLTSVNNAIQNNTSEMIVLETPVIVDTLHNIRHIQFSTSFSSQSPVTCIIVNYTTDRKIYKRLINDTTLTGEELITDNVFNFTTSRESIVCVKNTSIDVIDVNTFQVTKSYYPDIVDPTAVLAVNDKTKQVLFTSAIDNRLKIFGDISHNYTNDIPYTSAVFDSNGKVLVVGQPKNGKVIIFYKETENWIFFQEITLDGFAHKFDIDSQEKTLVITSQSERTTNIYENISYDLSIFEKNISTIPNTVSSAYSNKYYECISLGYKNVILGHNDYPSNPPSVSGTLYADIPYYIPSDGNVIFSIYETITNGRYIYHVYGNELSGNLIDPIHNLMIYSESGLGRLKSITSDRRGETVFLLRHDNLLQIYKRVNLDNTIERYVFVQLETSNFRDIWTQINYNPLNNGVQVDIDKIQFNKRGNIMIVQQGPHVVVLHYEQEILMRQKAIGHPDTLTEPSDNNLPQPKTENGYRYLYLLNRYYLLSRPIIAYILDETFIKIDDDEMIYTWKNDKMNVYSENNFYREKIDTIQFQTLNPNHIQYYPEERLFTYKDNTNIYFYYHDKLNHTFINTNKTAPLAERYNIIDNHIVRYTNKNIEIDNYTIDIIQDQSQNQLIDFSFNRIYNETLNTSFAFSFFSMDERNNINVIFKDSTNTQIHHYSPISNEQKRYKHMITFHEQKIDVDVQYKHEEFYNNVIQVLPANYVSGTEAQNRITMGENENRFKIYCPEKFTYTRETDMTKIHTFTPNFNKNVFYDNEVVVSKYFNPKEHTTLFSVLRHMNTVNDNRAISLYRITENRYVGVVITANGGTKLVKYKYTLLDKDENIEIISSRSYTNVISEKLTSVGLKYYFTDTNTYSENASPERVGEINGIYVGSKVPIRDPVRIRYDVDLSVSYANGELVVGETLDGVVRHPENIEVYVMTELIVDIITEETIRNSSYLATNDMEYGKFTNMSPDGNLIVIGSNVDTLSNVYPGKTTKKTRFNIWFEQSFIHSEANFRIGQNNQNVPRHDFTYTIDRFRPIKGKDDGLTEFLDMNEFNTIQKIEDHVNRINNYYGGKLIVLEYASYYGINANNVGGLGGRRMFFYIGPVAIAISEDMTRWEQHQPLRSPNGNRNGLSGQNPKGSVFDTSAYVHLSNDRPTSFVYTVLWAGGTECYANNITISYVLNMHISFTEEYLQRYHYNVIKFGCLFYYVNQKGRWRHLNTLYFKNSNEIPLRRSSTLFNGFIPDKLEVLNNYLILSKNQSNLLIYNILFNKIFNLTNIEFADKYFKNFYYEFNINYKSSVLVNVLERIKDGDYPASTEQLPSKTFNFSINKKNSIENAYNLENIKTSFVDIGSGNVDNLLDDHRYHKASGNEYSSSDYSNFFGFDGKNYIIMTPKIINQTKKTLYIELKQNVLANSDKSLNNYEIWYTRGKDEFERKYWFGDYKIWRAQLSLELELTISFSENLANLFGLPSEIKLNLDRPTIMFPFYNNFEFYQPIKERENFGIVLQKTNNTEINTPMIIGSIDKFEIFNNKFNLISKFRIKDKIGNLYIKGNNIYNSITDKGLIKKYEIPNLITPDPSYNIFPEITGKQILQNYTYLRFGNTFSIFNDIYAVVGTTEGKVIIQHLNDKTAAKAVINSGSSNYSNFGSVIRTGKQIYINAPELNRLYVISSIPYYE